MDKHTGIPIVRNPSRQSLPQPYGDVTMLNTCRTVMDSVGKEVLADIMGDYLDLLQTSAAIYERNGDYAQGLFTSGWCRKLDSASRDLCRTNDNHAALQSGGWHCHESCWRTSKTSIDTGSPSDMPCHGGIRIYAVPIVVSGQIVGSINFGYGDPPKDPQKLREIADRYGLSVEDLHAEATGYQSRPPHIIEIAKSRLQTAARLIAEIIERRHVEEKLRQLNESLEQKVAERTVKLEEAVKELESFAYSVSHDLRAPLRHIDGFSDLLQKHAPGLDEQSRRYVKTIAESAKQMGRLIDDLLTFARVGRAELHATAVNLEGLVNEALREVHPDLQGRQITWHVDPLPEVRGDSSTLRQVFVNLIANAVKFTRTRERARIDIGVLAPLPASAPRKAGAEARHDEVVIFIKDNGVGFDMQYVHKLFGVFQRLHGVTEFEGTGIGLALVQRVIRKHGGRVWADGAVNKGATFYFALPDKVDSAQPTTATKESGGKEHD